MTTKADLPKLKLLPFDHYVNTDRDDPLRFYYWPVIGKLYRQRVEFCLGECIAGNRILEIGFGSGVTFMNLREMYKEIHGLDLNAPVKDVEEAFKSKHINVYLKNSSVLSMPYPDNFFDTVLLISILEHLKPYQQAIAFREIRRVLKPGGQAIYGVPIERKFMVFVFSLLGCHIRNHHFSTEKDVFDAAEMMLKKVRLIRMHSIIPFIGPIYEIGHFAK